MLQQVMTMFNKIIYNNLIYIVCMVCVFSHSTVNVFIYRLSTELLAKACTLQNYMGLQNIIL